MIRSKLWFTCAAVHDPVSPMLVQAAIIGWEAKKRTVDLTIERKFSGEELVKRMKGWITVNPQEVIDSVKKYGFLKVFEDNTLVVELDGKEDYAALQSELNHKFGTEVFLEEFSKK